MRLERCKETKKYKEGTSNLDIQGDCESCAEILTTSYWLHEELGKNI
jgi:hypothetical protein